MNNDEFKFDDIAGQPATLEINALDTHCVITWGDLLISDASGEIGFWTSFNKKPLGSIKGAARDAALKKHAREMIQFVIYEHVKFLQEELANA